MLSALAFNDAVASFTDANPGATTADFTATINWGDATTSAGTVSGPTGGPFTVSGRPVRYREEGVSGRPLSFLLLTFGGQESGGNLGRSCSPVEQTPISIIGLGGGGRCAPDHCRKDRTSHLCGRTAAAFTAQVLSSARGRTAASLPSRRAPKDVRRAHEIAESGADASVPGTSMTPR